MKNPSNSGSSRDSMFDVFRVVAAVAVTIVHSPGLDETPRWSLPLRFAVPFYCCAGIYFGVKHFLRRTPPDPLREYADQRFQRIYRPFLAWSLLYVLFQMIAALVGLAGNAPEVGFGLFIFGTAGHLWFIPFIFAACFTVYALMPWIIRAPRLSAAAFTLCAVGISATALSFTDLVEHESLVVQMIFRLAPVCAGAAISIGALVLRWRQEVLASIAIAGVAFATVATWLAMMEGGSHILWGNAIGVPMFCVCLTNRRFPALDPIVRLGPYALGIYFSHFLFLEGFEDIVNHVFGMKVTAAVNAAIIGASLVSSMVTVVLLDRWPETRFLVR
jgi:peptidoglycan/LPS O-acetylase OafA/YrhL